MRVAGLGEYPFRIGRAVRLLAAGVGVVLLSGAVRAGAQVNASDRPAGPTTPVTLTPEERAWLDGRSEIVFVYADGFEPEVIVDSDGTYRGYLVDILVELSRRLGIRLRLEIGAVEEGLAKLRSGRADAALALIPDYARQLGLLPTRAYFQMYPAAFTRQGTVFDTPSDLAGKQVAFVAGTFYSRLMLERYGRGAVVVPVKTAAEGLRRLAEGRADVYLGRTTNSFLIRRYHFLGLAEHFVFQDDPLGGAMAVRPDLPLLASILDKGLASFRRGEVEATIAKWVEAPLPQSVLPSVQYAQGFDWGDILPWAGATVATAVLVIAVVLVWNRRLQREVRQRRTAEERLVHAKAEAERASRSKSLFLANMSHELRTPLNAILGFSSMLDRDAAVTGLQKQKLAVIRRSGQHLLGMINDILDLSKIEAGRIELEETAFDLVALLEDIWAALQPRAVEKGLAFSLHTDAVRHRYVSADAGKIRHILGNLLGNAIKFTASGEVTLRCVTLDAAGEAKRCEVQLEVSDTGPGIDPAMRARVFEPFVQERAGGGSHDGVGLGLSICKNLVDVMEGTIEVESEPGRGSLFRVRFPAGAVDAAHARTDAESVRRVIGLAPAQRPWRILVVDDNPDDRAVLRSLLEDASFIVLEAANGREGVEAFSKYAPDLVWLDMQMAVMDGYEAVRQIRRLSRGDRTPVIALTASAFREQAADIMAAGCDDIVVKPASEREIFEAMQTFLPLEYRYDGDGGSEAAERGILREEIAALPDAVRELLRASAATLRQKELDAALDAVRALDPDLAGRLASLGQELRFDRILELVAASGRS